MTDTVDCSDASPNNTIDCSRPWAEGCTSRLRFEFASLWNFTQRINETCPTDPRLGKTAYGRGFPALTREACEHIAGSGFNYYESSVSWQRLTTWKFPLLQLLATFPRPPLGISSQFFVLAHLLGDPIDTIKNLLLKLSKCQRRAERWKEWKRLNAEHDLTVQFEDHLPLTLDQQLEQDQHWKALALLSEAYDEWGRGDDAVGVIQSLFRNVIVRHEKALMDLIIEIGESLAADRATKCLPIVVALAFFIGLVVMALVRTQGAVDSEGDRGSIFINLEVHNIAFSALFFWVIPAVILASTIGVSQTEERIRRILRRFHRDLKRKCKELVVERKQLELFVGSEWDRVFDGGMYSWRPLHSHHRCLSEHRCSTYRGVVDSPQCVEDTVSRGTQNPPKAAMITCEIVEQSITPSRSRQPFITAETVGHPGRPKTILNSWWNCHKDDKGASYGIVLIAALAGTLTSGHVPPEGFNCRVIGQICAMFIPWVLSAQIDFIFLKVLSQSPELRRTLLEWEIPGVGQKIPWWKHEQRTRLFVITYVKDVAVTLLTLSWTLWTILGCLNRCSCWLSKGSLILPQQPEVDEILRHRLRLHYPAFIFSGIAFELIIVPLCVWAKYPDSLRVFVQRDDGRSNWKRYWKLVRGCLRKIRITEGCDC